MSNAHKYTDKEIKEARYQLWRMGNLEWKLDPTQKEIYQFVNNTKGKVSVINASRRLGKSHILTIIAIQQCIQKPKSIVKFLQPEQKMIRMNIKPLMDKIFIDCPPELRPAFKTQDNVYVFPNGSEIQLAGTDGGQHEKLRGGDSVLCIIDEAAFVNGDLQYIVRSVLLPTTMLTRGKIILSSTSPREAAHDFAKYMEQAEQNGTLIKKTIYDALKDNEGLDNPRFTKEIIDEIIAEYPGGITNDEFRRECLCEILSDADNSVIPEFTASVQNDTIVEWPRPGFCTKYISMDIGFRDLTVALFAYYDFDHGVTVIEDEIVISGPKMTTEALAISLLKKEEELWSNKYTGEKDDPYLRIADNNLIVINDLQRLHGLTFLPTKKDNRDAQINAVRMEIGARQIYINPRCKTLIQHLKHATWNKNRDDFSRSTDNGHYDAVMALVYLIRNIDKNKNPYPPGYKYRSLEQGGKSVFVRSEYKEKKKYDKFNNLFSPKSSLKR